MATISFLAGENFTIEDLSGSGLGFYGANFGASVLVSEWQDRTFITDGAGTSQGPEADNVKYHSSPSGILGQAGSGVALTCIPNYQSTLGIQFSHDSAVQAQNVELRIYDRSDINKAASGVTTMVAEIIHPGTTQDNSGSGDTTWIEPWGSGVVVDLSPSPGISGLWAGDGTNSTRPDTQHNWYVAISASADSVGSKTQYGLYVSLEYL